MENCYGSFDELIKGGEIEGVDYSIETNKRKSDIIIISPHGGLIENGTTEISRRIAEIGGFSYYSFLGTKQKGNFKLHISSSSFDEPVGLNCISSHQLVTTIHGCKGVDDIIYVGGKNVGLRTSIIQALNSAGFSAPDFSDTTPFKGSDDNNICNKGLLKKGGVQIEVSRSLRDRMVNMEGVLDDFSRCIVNVLQGTNI